ncbi:MAG: sulfur-carrier protein [Miltoncostaeaceae bacterium]|nr:sulfur-carrier protein [Miltoncostaeaceae bacterium]
MSSVRVALPAHLRSLAGIGSEVVVEVAGAPTIGSLLDALEAAHPALAGTIRAHAAGPRRAYMRYHACGEDLSFAPDDAPLPEAVARGEAPFTVIGAIAGG